jgi:hypothetical protein
MKKQLVIIGIVALLVSVGLSGCNEINNAIHSKNNRFVGTWLNDAVWDDYQRIGQGFQFVDDGSIKTIYFNMNDGTKTITDYPFYKWELNGNNIKLTNTMVSSDSYGTVNFTSNDTMEVTVTPIFGQYSRLEDNRLGGLSFDEVKIAGYWKTDIHGYALCRNRSAYHTRQNLNSYNHDDWILKKTNAGQWTADGNKIIINEGGAEERLCYVFDSPYQIEMGYCNVTGLPTETYTRGGGWNENLWW